MKSDGILILSGPNGYGKTTLFDAIEFLLCGRLKHFKHNLPNSSSETIKILANDSEKDIIISAVLCSDVDVTIERRISGQSDITLFWNGEPITQDKLKEYLKIDNNIFDMGMYISQNESLNFLQNKYKNRKEQLASILDNTAIFDKIKMLKEIENKLKECVDKKRTLSTQEKEKIDKTVADLKEQIQNIGTLDLQDDNYIRLFQSMEYDFDADVFPDNIAYEILIEPLDRIISFVTDFNEYCRYIQNENIDQLLLIPQEEYKAFFYSKQILFLKEHTDFIDVLLNCKSSLDRYHQNDYNVDYPVFTQIQIPAEVIDELEMLFKSKQSEEQQLNESQKTLNQLLQARLSFVKEFHSTTHLKLMDDQTCPLCGTILADINKAIDDTEQILSKLYQDGLQYYQEFEKNISEIFITKIIPKLKLHLEGYNYILEMNTYLSGCKNLAVDGIEGVINKTKMEISISSKEGDVLNIEELGNALELLQNKLKQNKQLNLKPISPEEIELYKITHSTFYNNSDPYHTLEQLASKRRYIVRKFTSKSYIELDKALGEQMNATNGLCEYDEKTKSLEDAMSSLCKKYEKEYKKYQSSLLNAIKFPLMIYSGKIIQNYPLGLGVTAVVKENQLVFEPPSKTGLDAYNILSTGQLNGLIIAIVLSVKSVYGSDDGLNILLIDDPLQTIDDISAISFADLLCQQDIGQIIISTHEYQKAELLRFKFNQAFIPVNELNMQRNYLSLKKHN